MNKRILIISVICVCVAVVLILYFFFASPSPSPLENIFNPSPEQDGNETPGTWKFPKITWPWSSNKTSGGGSGGSNSDSGSGSGGGNKVEPPIIKKNYTLSLTSPNNLKVLVLYTINDVILNETLSLSETPVSFDSQEGSSVCLAETTCSGSIRWLIDDVSDCQLTDCAGLECTVDCEILMDGNHSVSLEQHS